MHSELWRSWDGISFKSYFSDLFTVEQASPQAMGPKRGRLLIRQNRIKKDTDGDDMGVVIPRVIERQCSEPGPSLCSSPTPSPNLLSVPQPAYLVKQHSSPLLLSPSPATPPPTLQVHLVTPPATEPHTPSIRVRTEELRRASSQPQVSIVGTIKVDFHFSIPIVEILNSSTLDWQEQFLNQQHSICKLYQNDLILFLFEMDVSNLWSKQYFSNGVSLHHRWYWSFTHMFEMCWIVDMKIYRKSYYSKEMIGSRLTTKIGQTCFTSFQFQVPIQNQLKTTKYYLSTVLVGFS